MSNPEPEKATPKGGVHFLGYMFTNIFKIEPNNYSVAVKLVVVQRSEVLVILIVFSMLSLTV